MNNSRIINYIALPVLLVAAFLGQYWVLGLLFLWWLVPSIIAGQAHLVFDVNRTEDPICFG